MFVKLEVAKERYSICKTCEFFAPTLRMCRECRCVLPAKVTLAIASCPKGKWNVNASDPKTTSYSYKE